MEELPMFGKITPQKIDKWKQKQLFHKIIPAVNHKDEEISEKAFKALDEIGGTKAVEDLIGALHNKKYKTRVAAALGLGRLGDKSAVTPLLDSLNDRNNDVRVYATIALGKIKDAQATEPLIRLLNEETTDALHNAAVDALVNIGEPSVDKLIEAIDMKNPIHTRKDAVRALGRIAPKKALNPLIKSLSDPSQEVRIVAENALKTVGKYNPNEIIKLLDNDELAASACRILASAGDIKSSPNLLKLLDKDDLEIVAEAINALGNTGDKKIIDPLINILHSDKYKDTKPDKDMSKDEKEKIEKTNKLKRRVRRNAVLALGYIEASKASDEIINALKDSYIRSEAAESILRLGESVVLKAMEKDEWVKSDLLHALKKGNFPDAKHLREIIN